MMKPERLVTLPLEAARVVGHIALWALDKTWPASPTYPVTPAHIEYYRTDYEDIVA